MEPDHNGIGRFIRLKRLEKRMTIRQVALYAKCSSSYLSMLERGRRGCRGPTPHLLAKLSKPLGVPIEVLLDVAGYTVRDQEDGKETLQRLCKIMDCDFKQLARRVGVSKEEISFMARYGISSEMFFALFEKVFEGERELSPIRKMLARETGLSSSFLSQIESGQRQVGVATARRILMALGVEFGEVFEMVQNN